MDNEFRAEQLIQYLNTENIEVHLTKPNNHTGNADIERLHSTLLEKLTGIDDTSLSTEMRMQIVIANYNDRYHSTIKCSPRFAKDSICPSILQDRINLAKRKVIAKHNSNREEYTEYRESGPIKNYKRVRHKDQPYFRINPLQNVHPSNIKRPQKFANIPNLDTENNYDDDRFSIIVHNGDTG